MPAMKFVDMNNHHQFYDELNDESKFVQCHVLNFRELKKKRKLEKEEQLQKSAEISKNNSSNYPIIV
jgi:hypothetical protein